MRNEDSGLLYVDTRTCSTIHHEYKKHSEQGDVCWSVIGDAFERPLKSKDNGRAPPVGQAKTAPLEILRQAPNINHWLSFPQATDLLVRFNS